MSEKERTRAWVTYVLGAAWCLMFLWMAAQVLVGTRSLGGLLFGVYIPTSISHLFGDVTPRALYAGQFWRAITATFVHFNLVHLLLNLIGLIQLGRMMESWYGSSVFLFVYALLAAFSNIGANMARPILSASPDAFLMHSGGGSTVVLGLVGMVTVIGWRNPTEFPKRARWWLVALLVFNFGLGLLIPRIDNLGHLGGVVAGALLGLMDPLWLKWHDRKRGLPAGIVAGLLIVSCLGVMFRQQGRELSALRRVAETQSLLVKLGAFEKAYGQVAARGLHHRDLVPPKGIGAYGLPPLILPARPEVDRELREDLKRQLRGFKLVFPGTGATLGDKASATLHQLSARALTKPPTPREQLIFVNCVRVIAQEVGKQYVNDQIAYRAINSPPPVIARGWLASRFPEVVPPAGENRPRVAKPGPAVPKGAPAGAKEGGRSAFRPLEGEAEDAEVVAVFGGVGAAGLAELEDVLAG